MGRFRPTASNTQPATAFNKLPKSRMAPAEIQPRYFNSICFRRKYLRHTEIPVKSNQTGEISIRKSSGKIGNPVTDSHQVGSIRLFQPFPRQTVPLGTVAKPPKICGMPADETPIREASFLPGSQANASQSSPICFETATPPPVGPLRCQPT